MANNPENSGAQFLMVCVVKNLQKSLYVSYADTMPKGQPFIQMASGTEEFRSPGQAMSPGQSQVTQITQPLQQMSAWSGQPRASSSSPFMQQNMAPTSCSLHFQNSATTNNHVPGLGGPEVQLSSPFTFSTPSFGHPQNALNVSSRFQSISQMHMPIAPMRGQHWLPYETPGASAMTYVPQNGMQSGIHDSTNQSPSVPNANEEESSHWQVYNTSDGRRYFYNMRSKTSSWEKPLELMTPLEMSWQLEGKIATALFAHFEGAFRFSRQRADASTVWKEFTTAEGKTYYYNNETKQSKWKMPEELKLASEQAEKEASGESESGMVPNADTPAAVKSSILEQPLASVSSVYDSSLMTPRVVSTPAAGLDSSSVASCETHSPSPVSSTINAAPIVLATTSSSPKTNLKNSCSHAVDGPSVQDIEEAKKGLTAAGNVNATQLEEKAMYVEPLMYASKQEAKAAFKSLLESANLEADWSWEQAMRMIINDKRYGALKTLGERKQAFNEYVIEKKKLEAEERYLNQRKAKDEFTKMLKESKELTSSMRWSKAMALFEEDHRYKAIEQPADREDLFQNYLAYLKKKERAKAQEEKRKNRLEYRHFLESCGFIKVDTQWRKVKDRLEDDERCSRLDKIDRLEIFQEYIHNLEKEEEELKKLKKEQVKRVERKNRDEFRKMMEEHVVSGILTANTEWRDYFQKVKDSEAYLAVASNMGGATAEDLFEDVIEELEKRYHDDKTRVKDAMKMKKVAVAPSWTFEDFKVAVHDDIISPLSDINLQLVFDDLLKKAKKKEKKEYKKHSRLAKDSTELLGNIKAKKEREEKEEIDKDNENEKDTSKERFKDESDDEIVDMRNDKYRERKHHNHRHHQSGKDNTSSDEAERESSKKSRRHDSGHRKARKHAYSPESDIEGSYKRHKKDPQNGAYEELEDGVLGDHGEIC